LKQSGGWIGDLENKRYQQSKFSQQGNLSQSQGSEDKMSRSRIEWTESTWNPLTGCTKISPGCKHCYAERMAKRLQAMGQPNYVNGFKLSMHEHVLEKPLEWKTPQVIFVNSMSDLFHKDVPLEFIQRVFDVMKRAHWHQFQVLTKRSERLAELSPLLEWADNIWMGVSVENKDYIHRIDDLRSTGAKIKFLSIEPLLGPLPKLNLRGINWVIVGGESGPGARPLEREWVVGVRDQCKKAKVPFFFKQWGGFQKKKAGRLLDGRTYDEMPRDMNFAKA
jgi:protein gp37